MKAKKKPVEIDYFVIDFDDKNNGEELVKWIRSFGDEILKVLELDFLTHTVLVKTLEGTSYGITNDDIIIRGVKGEYYPCKKDVFELTYDKVDG